MTHGEPDAPPPADEMVEFYEQRTREHIQRVARNLRLLAEVTDHHDELIERAKAHDASKFTPEEKIPYVWLTQFHRCRRAGKAFAYPPGIEEQVQRAVRHHVTSNRHHPEYHPVPDAMTEVDLMEMVCDWTAMAQEFGQDGGSARGWADKTIGVRVHFNAANTQFIYRIIKMLDQQRTRNDATAK